LSGDSIMVAAYPAADPSAYDDRSERVMTALIDIVHSIRNTRAQYKVEMNKWVESRIYAGDLTPAIQPYIETIQTLGRTRPAVFLDERPETKDDKTLVTVLKDSEVYIPMASMVDMAAEKLRLQKEAEQAQGEITRLETRLADASFLGKAPAAVVEKERQRLADARDRQARLNEQLEKLGA